VKKMRIILCFILHYAIMSLWTIDSSAAENKDPVLGIAVSDSTGSPIGVISDILGTSQTNVPLTAIKVPESPIFVVIPISEMSPANGIFRYWGTKSQFEQVPKRYVLLAPGTSSLALNGPLPSALSVLASQTASAPFFIVDQNAPGNQGTLGNPGIIQPQGVVPNRENPFGRAGSDIKSLWGGSNSPFPRF
jgi:hypothetical protein